MMVIERKKLITLSDVEKEIYSLSRYKEKNIIFKRNNNADYYKKNFNKFYTEVIYIIELLGEISYSRGSSHALDRHKTRAWGLIGE